MNGKLSANGRYARRLLGAVIVVVVLVVAVVVFIERQPRDAASASVRPSQVTLIDITSADVPRDRAFYERTFGWTLAADYPKYPILAAGDGPEIGIATLGNPEAGGLEPLYRIGTSIVFFGVPDIPAALARARELGGAVVQPPTPISTGGSFAMFTDPVGNTIALMQPSPHAVASPHANPATLVAISTPDVPGTRTFYERLFGLHLKEQSPGYPILTSGGGPDIGIALADDPAAGPARPLYQVGHPVVLLRTPSIDTTLREVIRSGGRSFEGRTPLPSGGAYGFFTDPSGNTLGLLERP
ncbi:VOC family protein [Nocardia terpenica]|uniref:VOC family protein n=1 Tax=Nocardia terpenica TaxID=455432 RepID=UPI001894A457|nr:VOC family protein [Nocardia terpenica]MBF6061271.1 VOC family protein [Nocardia terpenica]MBF6105500.1 VOC family protein [Nocardia terpenica]MBF6113030.1 VOC family protein [Nocardia terpenica]MBF6119160.1 VOC family protein [Nocardia terpenica]MBF6152808.1 VOC family protein [Nocardia terpenica]